MSRSKKSRKPEHMVLKLSLLATVANLTLKAERKRLKRKGLKSGSRHSDGSDAKQRKAAQARDPRLGRKKSH